MEYLHPAGGVVGGRHSPRAKPRDERRSPANRVFDSAKPVKQQFEADMVAQGRIRRFETVPYREFKALVKGDGGLVVYRLGGQTAPSGVPWRGLGALGFDPENGVPLRTTPFRHPNPLNSLALWSSRSAQLTGAFRAGGRCERSFDSESWVVVPDARPATDASRHDPFFAVSGCRPTRKRLPARCPSQLHTRP